MSDFYQYSDIMRVVRVPIYPESNIKGRGLVYYGDKIIEFQTALACKGESIFERNTAIRERVTAINQMDKGKRARRIPVIPAKPEWEAYTQEDEYAKLLADPYLLPNGYDAETAAYSALDLSGFWTYAVRPGTDGIYRVQMLPSLPYKGTIKPRIILTYKQNGNVENAEIALDGFSVEANKVTKVSADLTHIQL